MFNDTFDIDISYTDFDGTSCSLTPQEFVYFCRIADDMRNSIDRWIKIIPDNHERLKGKSKEDLGIFYTSSKEVPFTEDCYITIDTWFIHECYMQDVKGTPSIESQSLVHVIAHELAHSDKFRHCKYHTRLTNLIINAYDTYRETSLVEPFDDLIQELNKEVK